MRSKAFSFNCNHKNTNKLKGISKPQSKNINFEEYKKCLVGEKYQKECDNYFILSLNQEMYLQKIIDDKKCYGSNIKTIPRN